MNHTTYTIPEAAERLALSPATISAVVNSGDLPLVEDADGKVRIPAISIQSVLDDDRLYEHIAGYERVPVRHLSLVSGISYSIIRHHLAKARLSSVEPEWGQVRGQWNLPNTYRQFKAILGERLPAWMAHAKAHKENYLEEIRRKRDQERAERRQLKNELFKLFPTWETYDRQGQQVTLHLGPTNSGKTFQSLNALTEAGSGWYLAPLRLLAREVFTTLNANGVLCNLLTGEEVIPVDGARITAATIEMFSSQNSGACVVIDEAHMLSDAQRGWAWTRAIMEARADFVHIIGSPSILPLIRRLAEVAGFVINVESYERLTPLEVAPSKWSLSALPAKTILVAFSRKTVLALKTDFDRLYERKVSVIYGNLPPEVRLRQAERFASGETEICIATDAIGMGLNLPADHVCFFETSKFDGTQMRTLTANEIRQIAGRAGRYGLSHRGWVGALNKADLDMIRNAITADIDDIEFARAAPTPESIALLPGRLYEKLERWVQLEGIPPKWREMLKPADLTSQIELARMLSDRDVERAGEETALLLVNAPASRDSQDYWLNCARAIIHNHPMPLPDEPAGRISSAADLEKHETAIRSSDVYLWLSQRESFARFGRLAKEVREKRLQWTRDVDAALRRKIDTTRRCRECGRSLPVNYPYKICQRCYHERWH